MQFMREGSSERAPEEKPRVRNAFRTSADVVVVVVAAAAGRGPISPLRTLTPSLYYNAFLCWAQGHHARLDRWPVTAVAWHDSINNKKPPSLSLLPLPIHLEERCSLMYCAKSHVVDVRSQKRGENIRRLVFVHFHSSIKKKERREGKREKKRMDTQCCC
jgi:hypothetical protein